MPLLLALELIAIARAVPIDRRSTPSDREVSARDSPDEDLESDLERERRSSKMAAVSHLL